MDGQSALKRTTAAKVGRASRTLGQLWQVPAFAVGLLALALVAATAPMRQDHGARQFNEDCDQLRLACGNARERIADYLPLADSVLERATAYPAKSGLAHFLAGSVYACLAEQKPPMARESRRRAITLFEQAQKLGVPDEDNAALLFRLGQALFKSGDDPKRASDFLARGVEHGTDQPGRGYGMLVEAELRLPNPNLDKALSYSQKQLAYTGPDSERDLWRALLLRGELLRRKGRLAEAVQELAKIPASAPRQIRLPARLLQNACCQEERRWSRAVPIWLELLTDAAHIPGGKAYILYQLGLCYHNADRPNDREAESAWQQVVAAGGAEGQAASLRLGELYLLAEPANPDKGLAQWTRALARIQRPQDYHNQLLTLPQARTMFDSVWQAYQEKRDYRLGDDLAQLYKKIAAAGVADELLGQSLAARARALLEKAGEDAPSADQSKQIRSLFHQAGAAFEAAADARPLAEQALLLAHSADCWGFAQEPARTVAVLQRFVRLNNTETALAEGFLKLANALRALGQKNEARQALYRCIEFPATPFAYRARYDLALEAIDNKELEQAEEILKQNLTVTGMQMDREAHEQSLYQLAALVFQRPAAYEEATVYLKDAVRQYPYDPQAFVARDRLAYCYRWLANDAKNKLQDNVSAEAKTHYHRRWQESLEEATRTYQALADDLDMQARTRGPLSPVNLDLLRKAQFAIADMAMEKNELKEALRRYQQLLDSCGGQWYGIRACLGIWQCGNAMEANDQLRAQGRDATRQALARTLKDVNNMPDTHEAFRGENRRSRRVWLEWLEKSLQTFSSTAAPAQPTSQPRP